MAKFRAVVIAHGLFTRALVIFLSLLAPSVFGATAVGAGDTAIPDRPLRVGLHQVPPYVVMTKDGQWSGLGVQLWKQIAEARGWKYEWVPLPYEELLTALASKELDVVVGELLVNSKDEEVIDFSQPFLTTSLGVTVSDRHFDPGWLNILLFAFDWTFLKLFLGMLPVLIIASLVVWHFERKRNAAEFGGRPQHGLGSAFWFITVTMTTTGYGDKAPITAMGRLVTIVWMFVSLFLMTAFTASVASTVATVRSNTQVASAADLQNFTNGVLHGSLAETVLAEIGAPVLLFEDLQPALDALRAAKVQTVVADSTVIHFLIKQNPEDDFRVLPIQLVSSRVAMGLQQESPLREAINVGLLQVITSPAWQKVLQTYLGNSIALQN